MGFFCSCIHIKDKGEYFMAGFERLKCQSVPFRKYRNCRRKKCEDGLDKIALNLSFTLSSDNKKSRSWGNGWGYQNRPMEAACEVCIPHLKESIRPRYGKINPVKFRCGPLRYYTGIAMYVLQSTVLLKLYACPISLLQNLPFRYSCTTSEEPGLLLGDDL